MYIDYLSSVYYDTHCRLLSHCNIMRLFDNEVDRGLTGRWLTSKTLFAVFLAKSTQLLRLRSAVRLEASGEEKSPSVSVTCDPACFMQLTPISSSSSLKVLHHVSFSLLLFLFPSSGTQYMAVWVGLSLCSRTSKEVCCMCGSFSLQSKDMASHCPSPCCDNVLESLHAFHSNHLFICRMVALLVNNYNQVGT